MCQKPSIMTFRCLKDSPLSAISQRNRKGSGLLRPFMKMPAQAAMVRDLAMGREAGHSGIRNRRRLHFPMIIIRKCSTRHLFPFDKITRMIISSIIKEKDPRYQLWRGYRERRRFSFYDRRGDRIHRYQLHYDDHGHPELGNVSKAHIFNLLLQRRLKELNIFCKEPPGRAGL